MLWCLCLCLSGCVDQTKVCLAPRTVLSSSGECVCEDDYPFGDPNSMDGCYGCNNRCLELAKCMKPGLCKCDRGTVGDGVTNCRFPVPVVENVTSGVFQRKGGEPVVVTYSSENEYLPDFVYCQIGDAVFTSSNFTYNVVLCLSPPSKKEEALKVRISFDNRTWSQDSKYIAYDMAEKSFAINFQILFLIIPVVTIIIGYFYFTRPKARMIRAIDDGETLMAPQNL